MTKTASKWYSSLKNFLMQEDSKTLLGFGDTTRIVSEHSLALYEVLDQMQGY